MYKYHNTILSITKILNNVWSLKSIKSIYFFISATIKLSSKQENNV